MGVLWTQQWEISLPLCNSWRGKVWFVIFWSLTVHVINQISFEAGLEGLAFPPSWAGMPWSSPTSLPWSVATDSDGWWWTNPVWAPVRLLKPCWPGILGIELLGGVWECTRHTKVCPSSCCPQQGGKEESCHGQTLNRILFSPGL